MNRFSRDAWYVITNSQQFGPIHLHDLKRFIADNLLSRSDVVWQPGFESWVSVEDAYAFIFPRLNHDCSVPPPLPADFPPPLPADFLTRSLAASALTSAPSPSERQGTIGCTPDQALNTHHERDPSKVRSNYIVRHWRGELPLTISFWFNGFMGYVVSAIVSALIMANVPSFGGDYSPNVILTALVFVWLITFLILMWQVIGTWRSASNYQLKEGNRWLARASKIMLIICTLQTTITFGYTGAPQLGEIFNIAAGDREVGPYELHVLRDGQELEFSGGITFGAAKELKRFLDAMGAVRLVHLNSIGGRIAEAQRMGDIIESRGLNTYVSNRCLSACTLVFLRGRERLISSEGRLGFHQPNFSGLTDTARRSMIVQEETRLRQLGLSQDFARRANFAAPDDMWIPTTAELLKENVATRVVNSFDFAMSGIGAITRDELEHNLLKYDLYRFIQRINSTGFHAIVGKFENGVKRGLSVADLRSEISPIVTSTFSDVLPYTSEENIIAFARLIIRHSTILNADDPTSCYFNINPERAIPSAVLSIMEEHKGLADEQDALRLKIFKEYFGKNATIPTDNDISVARKRVVAALLKDKEVDVDILAADDISPDQYRRYCKSLIRMYEETLKLPRAESVALMRYLFSYK
jgi:hypothetical protein